MEKVGEKDRELQKFDYLQNKNCFLCEIKSIFHIFLRAFFWGKKIAGISFNVLNIVLNMLTKLTIKPTDRRNCAHYFLLLNFSEFNITFSVINHCVFITLNMHLPIKIFIFFKLFSKF